MSYAALVNTICTSTQTPKIMNEYLLFKIIKLWRSLRDHKSMFGLMQQQRSHSQSLHTLLDSGHEILLSAKLLEKSNFADFLVSAGEEAGSGNFT